MSTVNSAAGFENGTSERDSQVQRAERRLWTALERLGHGRITIEAVRELDRAVDERLGGLKSDPGGSGGDR
jgi:hypothetical protein